MSGSAGSLISFTIISKDTYGNIRYNPTGGYAIEINDVSWTVQNNKDGTYFVTFTPMIAEIYTISVYVNSIYIQGSPAYITIKPSGVRGYYSSLDVSNVTAGKGFFNIASRDIGGNVVINPVHNKLMGNMHYVFSIKGEQSLMQNAGYMNYAAFFINFPQITKAGDYTVVLGLIEELGLTGFYYQGNDFTNMYEVLPYFNNPGDLIQFYTEKDAQVSFNWATRNPIINNASISSYFSVKWQGKIYLPYTDTYTFYVLCDYRARLTINGIIILDNISTKKAATKQSGSISLTASVFYNILLEYQNGGNFGYISLQYSSSLISLSTIPSSVLYTQMNSNYSPYSFSVIPSFTNPSACIITTGDSFPLTTAYSGIDKVFIITAYDSYGNLQTDTDTFFAIIQGEITSVNITGTNGTYSGSFILDIVGFYTLIIYLQQDTGVINTVTSIVTQVFPGAVNPQYTTISGLTKPSAGSWIIFNMQLFDFSQNMIITGENNITVDMENIATNETVPSSQIFITNFDNGTYACNFTSYIAGTFDIIVYVNDKAGPNSIVIISPLDPYPNNCIVVAPLNVTLGSLININISLYDIYLNPSTSLYPVFAYAYLSINPNMKLLKFNITQVSSNIYQGVANFSTSEIDISGQCIFNPTNSSCNFVGALALVSGIFTAGIHAEYYNNLNFSGVPDIVEDESFIDYTWGNSVLGINSSDVSVYWQGFIQSSSLQTSGLNLQISGSGYAFVNSDMIQVISLPAVPQAILPYQPYYLIEIWYNNTGNYAAFKVQWLNAGSTTYADVPAINWFRFLDNTPLTGTFVVIDSI